MRKLIGLLILSAAGFALSGPIGAQTPPPAAQAFSAYEGTFRLPSGRMVLIARLGVIDEVAQPYFLDEETGRFGSLVAAGADKFFAAPTPGAAVGSPPEAEILFSRDAQGAVSGLVIRETGIAEKSATRFEPYTDREAAFDNGPVRLAATLRVPKGPGPFPAIVLVHGSGPGTRTQLSLMSSHFARLGLAVLWYDKRGCGKSGGDWKKVDLDVLAEDALAGVRYLKGLPEIDARRVGLWGISQGGWITPLAASLSDAPNFVINSSGPATSLRRQDTYNMANSLKPAGFSEEEIAQTIKGMNLLYDYGRGRASAAALDAYLEPFRSNPKFKDLLPPPTAQIDIEAMYARQKIGDPAWFFHMNPDNDALTPYRKAKCPVLVTYGRLDLSVPVEESVGLLAELARETGQTNIRVEVIPDSGHGFLCLQESDLRKPRLPQTASRAFFAAIERWLRDQGIIG